LGLLRFRSAVEKLFSCSLLAGTTHLGRFGRMSAAGGHVAQEKHRRRLGIIWPHEPVIKTEIGTGKFMLRTTLAFSRVLRVSVLALFAITTAIIYTPASADARRSRHRHARHHEARESYNPAFSSIIV